MSMYLKVLRYIMMPPGGRNWQLIYPDWKAIGGNLEILKFP
jgi:hypothetical protein